MQSNKQMTFKDEVILIPSQALKYGHFVIPDKQIQYVETPASKQTQNWTKPTSKKSVEHSPLTGNSQFSMVTDSWGRPPTALKKSTVAYHSKNSMSTHIKKNSYFNSKTDDLQDDLDEFPQQPQERNRMTDSKQAKQSEEDSSVFKYKEYKKIYFHDAKKKDNEIEQKYISEWNNKQRIDKNQKKKSEYLVSSGDPASIKFDVLSDKADVALNHKEQKNANVIDKIVSKHLKAREKSSVEMDAIRNHESPEKSWSLLSLEQNEGQRNKRRPDTSARNDSYEVMELKSFNEIKHTDEEDKYGDSGLYGVFEKALLGHNDVDDGSRHSLNNDLTDSMEHVDTHGSNVSDSNLSPKSKQICKIVKIVKNWFKTSEPSINTTNDFYRIGKCIGKGAFGKVHLAVQKLTQTLVAIKSINKQYLLDEGSRRKVMQEVYILKKIRHWNVVQFYETFETEKYILLVMELWGGGDLLNYVRKRRRLKEDLAKYFFKQIIEGLHHIHHKNIVHRDIKLDNILLDHNGNVKICDFGVSKLVKPGEKMMEQWGTPAYIAPEILLDRGYKGFGVDVWSAGVVLYSMLYGTVPFKGNNMNELHKLIVKGNVTYKEDVSEEARNLLKGLLEWDPNLRLTTDQILKHEWLTNVKDGMVIFTETEKRNHQNWVYLQWHSKTK